MKYLKILGVAAVAAAALMAFASTASATHLTVTTKDGTLTKVPPGATITSELTEGEAILKSTFIGEVKCKESLVAGEIENEGGAEATVSGPITTLTFTNCNAKVVVERNGSLEVHTKLKENGEVEAGNGTLTSNGARVTTELAGLHCIFETNSTDIGTVTGTHEGHVKIDARSATIPRVGGRSSTFCGPSATWNATYTVTTVHFPVSKGGETFTNFTVV